jgi:glutathione S-transferase
VIFHLALDSVWDAAAPDYRGSTIDQSLDDVGFVHCSTDAQLQATADRFYRRRDDVVLLTIDPTRLDVPVRFEEIPSGERFPHIYGPVPRAAVVSVVAVALGDDGRLEIDAALAESPNDAS